MGGFLHPRNGQNWRILNVVTPFTSHRKTGSKSFVVASVKIRKILREILIFKKKFQMLDLAVKFSTWGPAYWLHTKAEIGSSVALRVGGDFHYPNLATEAAGKLVANHSFFFQKRSLATLNFPRYFISLRPEIGILNSCCFC